MAGTGRRSVGYAAAAALLFAVEVAIARFVHDGFVRPFLGDSLAVALVYCGLRAITPLRPVAAASLAFAIACAIEAGQAIHLVDRLGLGSNRIARVVLGTSYDPHDFIAYGAGALLMLAIERWRGIAM